MKQGDTVFVSATATGLGKDKKAVIDKIENVMGTTFVTVTYTHPDAVSGLGGCFVASHIIETDSREKSLIRLALEDRWDAVTGNDDIAKVLTALYDWQVDELMTFIDGLVELKPNRFSLYPNVISEVAIKSSALYTEYPIEPSPFRIKAIQFPFCTKSLLAVTKQSTPLF